MELCTDCVAKLHECDFEFAADGVSDTDGYVRRHASGEGGIREPNKFELHGRGAGDLLAATNPSDADRDIHADGGRKCGRLQFQRARCGDGWKRHYA